MEEIWKDIKDYEGYYQVSNLGRVRSLDRVSRNKQGLMNIRGRLLQSRMNKYGYITLKLTLHQKSKNVLVHRLMAEAFLPNPNNLPCVNHKSECKTENFVWVNPDGSVDPDKSNLEWCTHQYNIRYGTAIERGKKKKSKPVLQFTKEGVFVNEYPSTIEASRQTGIVYSSITSAAHKVRGYKSAGGFIWRYKNSA